MKKPSEFNAGYSLIYIRNPPSLMVVMFSDVIHDNIYCDEGTPLAENWNVVP